MHELEPLVCSMKIGVQYLQLYISSGIRPLQHTLSTLVTPSGQQWRVIWQIRWSPDSYWRSLRLWTCVMWRSGWLLTNWRQLMWINDWIFQCRMHSYHRWWQLITLWVTVLAIKAPVITRSRFLPTMIVPCSIFVETTYTLWTWHDEWNMSF